jgi:VanZ family protein
VLRVGVDTEARCEEEVVFKAAVVVVLVYVGVCPSAARMYAPRRGATVVDVILGVRLTAERFPYVAEKSC